MFSRILIATDGSSLASAAAHRGLLLAERMGAQVLVITVVPRWHVFTLDPQAARESLERFEKRNRRAAEAALQQVALEARSRGIECRVKRERSDEPWEEIVKAGKRWRADLIVMGSHGHGALASVLLGSQAQKVLVHSKVPVMVCR